MTTTKTAQSAVQSTGGDRGDPRREDVSQLGSQFKVHPTRLQSGGRRPWADAGLFVDGRHVNEQRRGGQQRLYEEIGRAEVELDWLKKKWECSTRRSSCTVERSHSTSASAAMRVAGRQSLRLYYERRVRTKRTPAQAVADEQNTRTPFLESKNAEWLVTRVSSEPQARIAAEESWHRKPLSEAEAEPAEKTTGSTHTY